MLAIVTVVCLTTGLGLIIYEPVLKGEEWIYRDKALALLDRTSSLSDQYREALHDYRDGTIDQVTLTFRMFDYDSSITIIDGEAHGLTPLEGYEDFQDHVIAGIHIFYNMMFYRSMNESDIDAAVNEINYARTIMPDAKTPKPIDTSLVGRIITFAGVIALVILSTPSHMMLLVNVPLTLIFGMCNFIDWNTASSLASIPCDWNVFLIATARGTLLNLSLIVFLITLLVNHAMTYGVTRWKLGLSVFPFIILVNFIVTICFIYFNSSDFDSLMQIFSRSSGGEAYLSWQFLSTYLVFEYIFATGDGRELWKGFVNLSMITFLVTIIALNLYMLRRIKQQSLD